MADTAVRNVWHERRREILSTARNVWVGQESAEDIIFTHHKHAKFIKSVGRAQRMDMMTVATATVFFHRFCLMERERRWALHRPCVVAMACLFLATKAENHRCKLRDIVVVGVHYYERQSAYIERRGDACNEIIQQVLRAETDVMVCLDFDFDPGHPLSFLSEIVDSVAEPSGITPDQKQRLTVRAWDIAVETLTTTLCCQYNPRLVAVVSVYMASRWFTHEFTLIAMRKTEDGPERETQWWKLRGCSNEFIGDMTRQIKEGVAIGHKYSIELSSPPPTDT